MDATKTKPYVIDKKLVYDARRMIGIRMNDVTGLWGEIDPVEFLDVDAQADGDVVCIAVKILKLHARIEYTPVLIQLPLYAYLAAVVIKNDTGPGPGRTDRLY